MQENLISNQNVPEIIQANPIQAIKLAEQDLNWLAALCLMDKMQFLFPSMFVAIWQFMLQKVHLVRDFSKLAIGIPRGFAKTTLMKIFIVFVILFTRKTFILVIAGAEEHAINVIKDACDMLSSPNIVTLFGDWKTNLERNQQKVKIMNFRSRKITLAAVGADGSIRGYNLGNDRPDVMIFEDYQSKKDSDNETISNSLYTEMLGTIMKANSPFGCLYIYVANMYPTPGSILKKLKKNPDWLSFIVGGILADGTSLWEDLQPLEQLLKEYEEDLRAGHPEVFLAEKLNDENAGIKVGIDITKIPRFPYEEDEIPQGRAIVIDPALDKKTSNYNGIGLVGLFDGITALEKVELGNFSPLQLIKNAIILAVKSNCRLITVENVAYQASLLFWFTKICEDNHIEGFIFQPLNIGAKSKIGKIIAYLKELMAKETFIKDSVRPLMINEIIKFNPLKANNQDTVLDLGTMCKKVYEQYSEFMFLHSEPEMLALQNIAPRSIEENCTF